MAHQERVGCRHGDGNVRIHESLQRRQKTQQRVDEQCKCDKECGQHVSTPDVMLLLLLAVDGASVTVVFDSGGAPDYHQRNYAD